jgi:hypothetical protein
MTGYSFRLPVETSKSSSAKQKNKTVPPRKKNRCKSVAWMSLAVSGGRTVERRYFLTEGWARLRLHNTDRTADTSSCPHKVVNGNTTRKRKAVFLDPDQHSAGLLDANRNRNANQDRISDLFLFKPNRSARVFSSPAFSPCTFTERNVFNFSKGKAWRSWTLPIGVPIFRLYRTKKKISEYRTKISTGLRLSD